MGINDTASLVSSLSTSFKQVPPVAIPSLLDCVLASTGSSAMAVFSSLIDSFPNLTEGAMKEDNRLDSVQCNYVASSVLAICHLLKKLDADHDAFQSFMWKCFIPLMNNLHAFDRDMFYQIVESFVDVVIKTNTWTVLEESLVPFVLSSVALSLGMHNTEGSDIIEQDRSFPLLASCHILSIVLDAAQRNLRAGKSTEPMLGNGCYSAEKLAANLLWDLCNIAEQMLPRSREIRSYGIGILLPVILQTFVSHNSLKITVDGDAHILSRNLFLKKIWNCCRTLFSLGSLERRDAYSILSLCLSCSCAEGSAYADRREGTEDFDLKAEKEFWAEIKRGLVDEEGIVRKQSLHILKMVLNINGESQCDTGINGESQCDTGISEKTSQKQHSVTNGMTKRERWADKEANSLGVGRFSNTVDPGVEGQHHWEAFILLYEMLEEYGTHLVEAAWNHQVTVLLQFSVSNGNLPSSAADGVHQNLMESSVEIFDWLAILWERGFCHGNPQVRCIIMQSFLGIEWKMHRNYAKSVPESFVLGPFMEGLNDPVHHKDFGVKGVYSSKIIEGAAQFMHQYTSSLNPRTRIAFLSNLASVAKQQSFGRVGLMALAECIASAACGVGAHNYSKRESCGDIVPPKILEESSAQIFPCNDQSDVLDVFRFVIECSKQHFNPNYRLQVCKKVLEAAASLVHTFDVPLEILLYFISALPREFTDYGGSLRATVQKWLLGCGSENCCKTEMLLLNNLLDFPKRFISHLYSNDAFVTYDDEDLYSWEFEAKRWARVFFLVVKEEHHLASLLKFIEEYGTAICKHNNHNDWVSVKFLIFTLSLVLEIQIMQERNAESGIKVRTGSKISSFETVDLFPYTEFPIFLEKLVNLFPYILEELVSFANLSCTIFWSNVVTEDASLPSFVRGKLGGPSQRRLSSSTATAVLQAIVSVKVVGSLLSWCAQFKTDASLKFAYNFIWNFFRKTVTSPTSDSETGAEINLAAYEALASVLKGLIHPQALDFISEDDKLMLPAFEGRPWLDSWLLSFLQNVNDHIAVGVLARTRRAILLNWKWLCLESLLALPCRVIETGENISSFVSDAAVRCIFDDLVESLENAGEGSVLPMLRSVRLTQVLIASGMLGSVAPTCNGVDSQMMWHLVRSSWILHVSCNKRRVAPIAALLSSVLHSAVFSNEMMHATEKGPGPLKWFIENILEEGTKSPRTIRLAALHLTGLWLSHPKTIKYYINELKLLTLYGSVAFDEDFEAELADNLDAKTEVSLLAKSPDPELTEAFINTELYARVSVAVMFYKLAEKVELVNTDEDCQAEFAAGKLFLLEILDFAVNDKDVARELYKKYSAIHRRKIRAWQMICVLSRFVDHEIVGEVTRFLHISLYRNNLPAVRQYLETFAINIYLKFPSLVGEQLVPILRDYDMRPQALASYVFVAANIILHASKEVQSRHLDELLPPIIPLLTSHHHSLRGFAQLLVYQVVCKFFSFESATSEIIPLEKRCFEDMKLYLANNSDCARLRASMEGFLEAYDPILSTTPAGIFVNRVEELEFECVPTSLMERVLNFLNDVREDLRCSMAKDMVTIKSESLKVGEAPDSTVSNSGKEQSLTQQSAGSSLDFQKKITPSKHEKQDKELRSLFGDRDRCNQLLDMEKEDELFEQALLSRSMGMEKIRASRQKIVLVASFIDRIPNLAGLARTCEVFKASGLAIADSNILRDKQFQLISVTAEKWVPMIEVPVNSVKHFLERKKRQGYSILGLEQTANSIPLDEYTFPKNTVLVLGREKEGIPVDVIHMLDACIEIPQLGVVRSLNVHVSGAIALWEYTRQHRSH